MLIPVILGVSCLVFVMMDLAPGNMIDMISGDKINPVKLLTKYGDVFKMAGHTVKECLDELGMPEKAQGIFNF